MSNYELCKKYIQWANGSDTRYFNEYANVAKKEFDKFDKFMNNRYRCKHQYWYEEECQQYINEVNNYIKSKL